MNRTLVNKCILFSIVILYSIIVVICYILNIPEIYESLTQIKGMWSITIFILIRIGFTLGMTLFSFQKWFKQENLHYLDIDFLFGLFFLGLMYGKFIDLLYKLMYFTAEDNILLIILKIRYILIIITVAPLILIGTDNLLLSKSLRFKKLAVDDYRNRIDMIIIIVLIIFESLIVSLALNLIIISMILILIHIPSLIAIICTFFYAHKKKNLLQIKPRIIASAFLVDLILYIIATLINPLRRKNLGFSAIYVIFAEIVDLTIILIIFWGYYAESGKKSE